MQCSFSCKKHYGLLAKRRGSIIFIQ